VNTATQTINVNALPAVSFDPVADVCVDAPAFDLTQGSPATGTYSGPGITTSPEFDPATAGVGTHTITYTYADGNGCVNTATQTIKVNEVPDPIITGPSEVCLEGNIILSTPETAGHSYSWDVAGGVINGAADAFEVSIDFVTSGIATIEVTETNDITGCSTTSAVHNVTIHEKPSIGEIESDSKLTRR
jgi:hypothetical protein